MAWRRVGRSVFSCQCRQISRSAARAGAGGEKRSNYSHTVWAAMIFEQEDHRVLLADVPTFAVERIECAGTCTGRYREGSASFFC